MPHRPKTLLIVLVLGLLTAHVGTAEGPEQLESGGPWDGEVLQMLLGTWDGTGVVYGNPVTLGRDWSLDLAGHFVRGDMSVEMPNGFGFRALTFWRLVAAGHYEATWMDEAGDHKVFEAVADTERREIVAQYVDRTESGEKEWRRIVYRVLDEARYEEQMSRWVGGRWQSLAEFRFTRRQQTQRGAEGARDD